MEIAARAPLNPHSKTPDLRADEHLSDAELNESGDDGLENDSAEIHDRSTDLHDSSAEQHDRSAEQDDDRDEEGEDTVEDELDDDDESDLDDDAVEELVHLEDVMDELDSEDEEGSQNEGEDGVKKDYNCEYCSYSTNRRSDLVRHIRRHTGENLFNCPKCDYSTARKSDLRRHLLLHAGEKPFKCGVCNYTTSRKTVLLKHMRIHTANSPRARVILVLVTKEGQRVIHHNALADVPESSQACQPKSPVPVPKKRRTSSARQTPQKSYQCDKCEFSSTFRREFHEHKLTHGKEQKWKCPMCGYMTIRKSDMTRHYNIHIDNVFKCNLCEYKTVRHSDFVRHSKTHEKHKYKYNKT